MNSSHSHVDEYVHSRVSGFLYHGGEMKQKQHSPVLISLSLRAGAVSASDQSGWLSCC